MNEHERYDVNLNINVKFIGDPRTDEIICLLRKIVHTQENEAMQLDDILAKVQAQTTVVDGIKTLVQALKSEKDPVKLKAIIDGLDGNTGGLASVLLENTPADPTA